MHALFLSQRRTQDLEIKEKICGDTSASVPFTRFFSWCIGAPIVERPRPRIRSLLIRNHWMKAPTRVS